MAARDGNPPELLTALPLARPLGLPAPSADPAPTGRWRYLRPGDLRRLKNLFFAARHVVEGYYAGRHHSPHRGHSVEFADHRQYAPGDALADVDWKVLGRTDKLFIRLFEHTSDMVVYLLLDHSASMGYRGARPAPDALSKFDYGCYLAAALAFLTIKQQDKIAYGGFDERLSGYFPPGSTFGHLYRVLAHMEATQPGRPTALADVLRQAFLMMRKRGLLVLISDLLADPDELFAALSMYRHRGFEILLFHVLHSEELALPDELAATLFIDSESGARIRAHVPDIRSAYEGRIGGFIERLRRGCVARRIDYNLVSTETTYDRALERYLYKRGQSGGLGS